MRDDSLSDSRSARYALPGLGSAVIAFSLLLIVALWLGAIGLGARDQRMAVDNVTRANNQLARVFEEHTVRSLAEAAQLAGLVRSQYLRQGKAFDLVQFFKDAHIDQRLGARDLIYKPNTVDELCQAIARLLQPAQHSSK